MRQEDLDQTNRVDSAKVSKEGKPRPIIIKFTVYDVRNTVYKNNKLKGKNFLTAESLKAARVGILKDKYIQGKYEVRNLWTTDDCILKRIEYLFSENKVIKWH